MAKGDNHIERVVERAEEMGNEYIASMRERVREWRYGVKRATPEESAAFLAWIYQQYPRDWYRNPATGTWEFESPWVIAIREGMVDAKGAWEDVTEAMDTLARMTAAQATQSPGTMGRMKGARAPQAVEVV